MDGGQLELIGSRYLEGDVKLFVEGSLTQVVICVCVYESSVDLHKIREDLSWVLCSSISHHKRYLVYFGDGFLGLFYYHSASVLNKMKNA